LTGGFPRGLRRRATPLPIEDFDMRQIALCTAAVAALLLAGCATHEVDYQGEGEGVIGAASGSRRRWKRRRSAPAGEDAADDPAVWVGNGPVVVMGTQTPGFVAGTDKKAGLYIYGFDGAVLQFMPEGLLNNVDAVDGLAVAGRPQVVLPPATGPRARKGVSLYLFDPAGSGQNGVRPWARSAPMWSSPMASASPGAGPRSTPSSSGTRARCDSSS